MRAGCVAAILASAAALPGPAQNAAPGQSFSVTYQATSIGQYHPAFPADYSGAFSLLNTSEKDASLTTTLSLDWQVTESSEIRFDPEVAGGRGFSGTNGIANFPNGEITRVATATPKPYIARLYYRHEFGLGGEREPGSDRAVRRFSVLVGRFTLTDFFDNNRFSHDPRTQFMGWAAMYNGAWDYSADTRGYTWGWVHELHMKRWSLRYASAGMPRVANGLRFDRRVLVSRGDVVEGELRGSPYGREGIIRVLAYANQGNMGTYAEAIAIAPPGTPPDVTATRRTGTLKYGFGLSADQSITDNLGVFLRMGWNDGHTESFVFTAMDRVVSGGVSMVGNRWKRPGDTVGAVLTVAGLAPIHALYLERGGHDFLIGDGALRYGHETVAEGYYQARIWPGVFAGIDLQRVINPAYNQDRGPVWVVSLRVHIEGRLR
jgi:high affinity Mn2+ porin